jgi:hypothetical protein
MTTLRQLPRAGVADFTSSVCAIDDRTYLFEKFNGVRYLGFDLLRVKAPPALLVRSGLLPDRQAIAMAESDTGLDVPRR